MWCGRFAECYVRVKKGIEPMAWGLNLWHAHPFNKESGFDKIDKRDKTGLAEESVLTFAELPFKRHLTFHLGDSISLSRCAFDFFSPFYILY